MIEGFAPAKVNLALHVTGQRTDGYHLLDSLVMFADFGDYLTLQKAEEISISLSGPRVEGVPADARNLCWQAARFFGANVAITLEKHLPNQAGIGGGSADAAAVLRGLSELYQRPVPDGAEMLGADLPVCLHGRAARLQGVGEVITPLDVPPLPAILVNPGCAVETPQIFKALTRRDYAALAPLPQTSSRREFCAWLREQRNDLIDPALRLFPEIGAVLTRLSELPGQLHYGMSGSGATCFTLFDSRGEADLAVRDIQRDQPDWWVQDCTLS